MQDGSHETHRRRRRRATSAQGAPTARDVPAGTDEPAAAAVAPEPGPSQGKPGRKHRPPRELAERGMRELVGAGRSQLGVDGALRGRDVNRPTDADLADAEAELVIVRRHWRPDNSSSEPTGRTAGKRSSSDRS